jgi:hypothetical protein
MITAIPEKQKCQAFDPMMILPEKTLNIIDADKKANTSCLAPAFVYIEGSHGKKFLCDYHYTYERNMTKNSNPETWHGIEQFIIDERHRIQDTFEKNILSIETFGLTCSITSTHDPSKACNAKAFVKVYIKKELKNNISIENFKKIDNFVVYCNFHFRKNYYRFYSNGVVYEDIYEIIDERSRMNMSVAEEAESIKLV